MCPKTTEGKKGVFVHNTADDFYQYENAQEGWLTATMATCHQTVLFKVASESPIATQIICDSVDPDGDVSVLICSADLATGQ